MSVTTEMYFFFYRHSLIYIKYKLPGQLHTKVTKRGETMFQWERQCVLMPPTSQPDLSQEGDFAGKKVFTEFPYL